ncbi:hypothetical protein B0H14DRAFT_2578317 [Mycena olivaceomarginata]|nr:hypothetical protein B0H14DRAFT_2578317 [Mycena olivaceomarginata]
MCACGGALPLSLSLQMVCPLPLFSHSNYKNDADHDENTRKYWFVVFGVGLFTAQKDALQEAGNKVDGVHVFITRDQATRAWARHCRRRHAGRHQTRDPRAHLSDADSDTEGDTEVPPAPARAEGPVTRQIATGDAKRAQSTVGVKQEKGAMKRARHPSSAPRAASVPVRKRAVTVVPPSPEKKLSLFVDVDDSDDDVFKSDSSTDFPLAKPVAASRASSRLTSAPSTVDKDEDVLMPAAVVPAPAAPDSPTVSSVSSLSATVSTFSSISGPLRARAADTRSAGGLSRLTQYLLLNRKSLVFYDDGEAAAAEREVGESMEVVDTRDVLSRISSLGQSVFNRHSNVIYDDLNAALEERKPGESIQVVRTGVKAWISALHTSFGA